MKITDNDFLKPIIYKNDQLRIKNLKKCKKWYNLIKIKKEKNSYDQSKRFKKEIY